MAKLKLIDSDLLLDIIRASRPQPPVDQDLTLSNDANNKIDTLLQQPPSVENKAKLQSELNNQSLFLDKFYTKNSSPPLTPPQQEEIEEQRPDQVIDFFGVQEKKRVKPILDKINSQHSKLTWDKDHRLVINGRVIPQSNIYDLIKAVTGKSKTIKPTPGLQTFIKHLTELNIPLHIAGTDKVRRYLQTGDIDTHLDPLVTQTNKRKRLETGSGVKKTNNNCIFKRWV